VGLALLCAIGLTVLLPSLALAHAILLNSSPAKDAILSTPPTRVQMWFSEDLNPALSTAEVINAQRQRVDQDDAHVNADNSKELDLSLQANLSPAVYIVVWRSDSADDGHALLGSFIFTVTAPGGSVPQLAPGSNPGQGLLGDINATGTLDGAALFYLVMVTLVDLGAIFWAAGLLWVNFVLQPVSERQREEQTLNWQVEQRFEQRFSLPVLLGLLLANLGVLYGQVLTLTGNNWTAALNMHLLLEQGTSGRFGTYWLMRMAVLLLAVLVSLAMLMWKQRPGAIKRALPLLNLFLASLLLLALTMSGHAAAVSSDVLPYSVIIDWLHLMAASLWIGGMLYILLIYLPVLNSRAHPERARSLLAVLPRYSVLAIAGVLLMSVTGPFTASFHLNSLDQLLTTAYGRTLVVKSALVGALLLTSAYHVLWLRPRMKKEYRKYTYARERQEKAVARAEVLHRETEVQVSQKHGGSLLAQQVKLREGRLAQRTSRLMRVLRWEPWLGVAVLLCVGLLNIFASTLTPALAQPQTPPNGTAAGGFHQSTQTSDSKYTVTLSISPNRFGTNVFAVQVIEISTGKQLNANQVGVTVSTIMLDMDMGATSTDLQSDGKNGFRASIDFPMGGNWRIDVRLHTLDNTLHTASFKIYTPF
jgi:putative copper export protein/methionine-rich copper-binding protein CopC